MALIWVLINVNWQCVMTCVWLVGFLFKPNSIIRSTEKTWQTSGPEIDPVQLFSHRHTSVGQYQVRRWPTVEPVTSHTRLLSRHDHSFNRAKRKLLDRQNIDVTLVLRIYRYYAFWREMWKSMLNLISGFIYYVRARCFNPNRITQLTKIDTLELNTDFTFQSSF